jgi:protein-tyrosine-phosphatase/DNA-binding transcriptional ArsR family regulator
LIYWKDLGVLNQSPLFLKILGDDLRWNLISALVESDHKVQELAHLLDKPQNLVSYHLKRLSEHRLVQERRSSADGREVYYSLDLDRARSMFLASGESLHPSLVSSGLPPDPPTGLLPRRVLFLCTHNSARSQMAEGLLRRRSQGAIRAYSAGTHPGQVHPLAVRAMAEMEIDIRKQRSKHLDTYGDQQFDYVITVCDRAREECPVFPGAPQMIHWSIPDPVETQGPDQERYAAFQDTAAGLNRRIGHFLQLQNRKG